MDTCQLDVNNAFLQGSLDEDIYLAQPPGFIDRDRPTYVCKLYKVLYGLKQAHRAWYNELRRFLLKSGFVNSLSDTSLFILNRDGVCIYLLVYIDDIIISGDSSKAVQHYIDLLARRFSIRDLGPRSFFLGVEVTRTSGGLLLTQRRYISDILSRHSMADAKPVPTPLASTSDLRLHSDITLDDPSEYRQVLDNLQYLLFTHPDIAYVVNKLSQYMHRPTSDNWQALKRVLRYLGDTRSHGIFLSRSSPLTLHAFSDTDWRGDRDDFTSTRAHIVYLGHNPDSWSSKKQRFAAKSSIRKRNTNLFQPRLPRFNG
ncbi:PREDICTED: uncharacterized protein LOC109116170 [Tarenaya hassleriana]|uniref:uncharacterized protein LOC109116170 n=1 Tax=Tarenaya hassleriana TaxID=28532 RepID=UPI0008FD4775|nr:PREDICTED: uncharacterized protein LOC109116170 [Tarenaya hassleriana]